MKVACVLFPDFEAEVELLRQPDLAGKPVVVGGLPHEHKSVRSRTREAASFGIVAGMSLREAQGRCPDAIFLPADDELYSAVLARLLDTLDAFSPRVELGVGEWESGRGGEKHLSPTRPLAHSPTPSLIAFLDASGLELLFGPDGELGERIAAAVEARTGLRPRVGIGSGKFVAQMAATGALLGSAIVVAPGDEGRFLAPLPASWLPCSEEMRRRLDLFGLRTMGQLAALPRGALGEQFGKEGLEAARLARGIDDRLVVAREVLTVLREEVEIDPPAEVSHVLLAEARLLARRLETRMRSGYVACREVSIDLGFGSRGVVRLSTVLQEPSDSSDTILRAVDRLLGRAYARLSEEKGEGGRGEGEWESEGGSEGETQHPAPSTQHPVPFHPSPFTLHPSNPPSVDDVPAVSLLGLSLSGFGALVGGQMELFPSRTASLKKAQQAVRQAEETFGEGAIRPLSEMAAGRPPARRIRVVAEVDGRPRVLFLDGRKELVRELCNRWRVQEEWWRRELLREYYRIITSSGKLCLVFHDLIRGGWYVERVYG